ncbi:hypothetical protein Hte_005584 [Hypoxylon texense]
MKDVDKIDMPASIYKPLDQDRQEIRLLYLDWNGNDDEIITCRMATRSLKERLSYAALSYVWGTQPSTEEVIVNGTKVLITKSLHAAFWYLRKNEILCRAPLLALWADAICINQTDLAERGHQVKLMGSVYSNACYVISWLGEPTGEPDDMNFDLVRELAAHQAEKGSAVDQLEDDLPMDEDFGWMARDPKYYTPDSDRLCGNACWNAAVHISYSDYWTRIWIFQEMVLASCAERHMFLYGTDSVTSYQLKSYNQFISRMIRMRPNPPTIIPPGLWDLILRELSPVHIFDLAWGMRRSIEQPPGLVVSFISHICSATDPRDIVYGLLGVAAIDVTPDYEKPLADVYRDWFSACLAGPMDPSLFQWAGVGYGPSTVENLPSWVSNLIIDKEQSSSVVEPPLLSWSEDLHVEPRRVVSGNILSIHGVLLDSVSQVDHPCRTCDLAEPDPEFWRFCIDYIASAREAESCCGGLPPLQVVLGVLCHGADEWGNVEISLPLGRTHPLVQNFREFLVGGGSLDDRKAAVERLGLAGINDIHETLDRNLFSPKDAVTDVPPIAAEVPDEPGITKEDWHYAPLGLMYRSRKNAFFRTEGGYLGKGPPETLPGDKVCLLDGPNLLGLLRRIDDATWAYVGTCWVEGLSHGTSIPMIQDEQLPIEIFNLR